MSDPQTTGWRRIETAPIDGSKILVRIRDVVWTDFQRLGRYAGPSRDGQPTTGRGFAGCGGEMPTHWMPLPEANTYAR